MGFGGFSVTASSPGLAGVAFSLPSPGGIQPVIFPGGVVGAGGSLPPSHAIASNGIIAIYGQNFTADGKTKAVGPADLVDGKLPTSLLGTCAFVGGVPAPLFFVSPGQINAQVPVVAGTGPVQVEVSTNCSGSGGPSDIVPLQSAAPEFFSFAPRDDGHDPVAAFNAVTGVAVGAPGLVQGLVTAPAKPKDILTLYGTGFGVTNPSFQAGVLPDRAAPVTGTVGVRIGGVTLAASDILYTGVTPHDAGLYQLNLRVPASVPDGDQPVVLTINGLSSPPYAYLSIKR